MSEKKIIKVAVVGCGNIGKRHIAVLDANPDVKIEAICDTNEEVCQKLGALYKLNCYTDYSHMLDAIDIDMVSIATPHGLHAEQTIQALEHGYHVLVEKPMALRTEDCERMIAKAQEADRKVFVVKQNRYNKPIALTKEAIDSKRLGQIFMVQCNVMWNRHQGYYNDSAWRGVKALEGGALHTQVSHFIDLMIWWFGDVVSATTQIDTKNHDIEIEDCGVTAIRFSSGVIGSIFWTTCVYNKNYEGSITVIAENGTIKIGGKYLNEIDTWDVQSYPLPEGITFEDKPNDYGKYQGTSSNHHRVIEGIVEQFATGRKGVVEGDEALKTIRAIEMIYDSVRDAQKMQHQGS